jgi:hypothetical protein
MVDIDPKGGKHRCPQGHKVPEELVAYALPEDAEKAKAELAEEALVAEDT